MQMKAVAPYSIPIEPGRARAIGLAALVHALLLGFLWVGVRWQNDMPVSVEAEIWSPQTRDAAPRAPVPEPPPVTLAKPDVAAPPKVAPARERQPVPDEKPDIALEQLKKHKAELIKKQAAEAAEDAQRQVQERKLADQETREKQRNKEREQARQQQAQEQEQAQEIAQRELAKENLAKEKQKIADQKKIDLAKKRKLDEADAKRLDAVRADEMRRITGNVSATGGSGDAPKSQGGRTDSGYARKVANIIRSNTVFNVPESLDNNPTVEYVVDLLPDGEVKGHPRKQKSSGVNGFDEAVLRAIEKSTFPPDKTGAVPSQIIVSHKPKD